MEMGPLSNKRPVTFTAGGASERPTAAKPTGGARDSLEISDACRRRLAELADAALSLERIRSGGEEEDRSLSIQDSTISDGACPGEGRKARIEEIRRKINTGFYDRPDVRKKIADRIVDDLDM